MRPHCYQHGYHWVMIVGRKKTIFVHEQPRTTECSSWDAPTTGSSQPISLNVFQQSHNGPHRVIRDIVNWSTTHSEEWSCMLLLSLLHYTSNTYIKIHTLVYVLCCFGWWYILHFLWNVTWTCCYAICMEIHVASVRCKMVYCTHSFPLHVYWLWSASHS